MPKHISLRPALSSPDDGVLFARYLDTAADGLFRFMLGSGSEQVLVNAYMERGHDLSFEHVTFAVREDTNGDKTILGMVSAYSSSQHKGASNGPLGRAAGWRVIRLGAVSVLALRAFRFVNRIPDGDFYVQALAINPDARGEGTGTALLDHAHNLATKAGSDRFTLHVAVENVAARRLYERIGMHIEATSPKSFLPGMPIHRMVKSL